MLNLFVATAVKENVEQRLGVFEVSEKVGDDFFMVPKGSIFNCFVVEDLGNLCRIFVADVVVDGRKVGDGGVSI